MFTVKLLILSFIFLSRYSNCQDIVVESNALESVADDAGISVDGSCGCSGSSGLGRDSIMSNLYNAIDKVEISSDELSCSSNMTDSLDISPNANMTFIEGGQFYMGTKSPIMPHDGEGPLRLVTVSSFLIDIYEVSNIEYKKFVKAMKYVTESEKFGWSFVFDSAIAHDLKKDITTAVLGAEWWLPVNGSYWRAPEGPGTDVFETNRGNLPAVQLSWHDSNEYCKWRGGRLPTEAEWEYAASGGSRKGHLFPWGNKLTPKDVHRANIFQGTFPTNNVVEDGYEYLSPVDSFGPQNDYGLYNMIGNAWEWVQDWHTIDHSTDDLIDPKGPKHGFEKVKKGGSFLCHRSFCYRYRTAARFRATPDSATLNAGFRCVKEASRRDTEALDDV